MAGAHRQDGIAGDRSVLALNRGSSSVKFGLFTLAPRPGELCRGHVDVSSPGVAFAQLLDRLTQPLTAFPLGGVVHRLVHGGPALRQPQAVSETLVATLRTLVHLAPNHLPGEIDLIEDVRRVQPGLRQVVCFDTGFHADLPDEARRLPIADAYAEHGLQRYGFHGLSYTFLMDELRRRSPSRMGRVVLAHLGNGSSLAAVRDGRSIDTTMGFTPIGGVVMSTRTGDLDPGVVTQIARLGGLDPGRLDDELSHRSGLAALSGGWSDMRDLLAREADDPRCRLAVTIYCYEIRKRIGAFAAALGGLDALVFSGGIGERAPVIRSRICSALEFLNLRLDGASNAAAAPIVSTAASRVEVHVIPTDEEAVLARSAWPILQ
jgi:acetate kinase